MFLRKWHFSVFLALYLVKGISWDLNYTREQFKNSPFSPLGMEIGKAYFFFRWISATYRPLQTCMVGQKLIILTHLI